MMAGYEDWTDADWTVEALVGEVKDNAPDELHVEFRTEDGRRLRVVGMYPANTLQIVLTVIPEDPTHT